jgi:hypothetical protein
LGGKLEVTLNDKRIDNDCAGACWGYGYQTRRYQ